MGLLGFLAAGAVSGAGEAAQKSLLEQQKEQAEKDKIQFAADVKLQTERTARENMVDDIEERAQKLADGRQTVDPEAAATADNIAAASQQARNKGLLSEAEHQANLAYATKYANDSATQGRDVTDDDRTQAARQLGYITPEKAAELDTKNKYNEDRISYLNDKIAADLKSREDHWQTLMNIAELKTEIAKANGGKLPSDAAMLEYMVQKGMIKNTPEDLNKAYEKIRTAKTPVETETVREETDARGRVTGRVTTHKGGSSAVAPAAPAGPVLKFDPATGTFK